MRYGSIESLPNMSITKAKRTTQYLATLASTMGSVGLGAGLAWTSPSIPLLREDCLTKNLTNCAFQNQTQFLTEGQVQWVSGIFALGAMASALLTGLLISSIGRKWTIITLCLPMALGWVCLLLPLWIANSNYLFYVGRFLTGLGCGGFALAPPLYLGEIAETSIRGALGNTVQFMILLGMVIVSAFGIEHALNVKLITGLCLIPPILGSILMLFMPETPFYLVSKDKESEAMKALVWLRGTPNVQDELNEIKRAFEDQKKIGSVSFKHFFANKVYLKPLLLMATLMFFQQFSGINAVNFNLVSIFQDVGSDLDEGLQGFIITIAQWIGCGMTVFVVDKLGRKTLLCISATIMCISIFTMGTFFYLKENQVPDSNSTTFSLELTQSQVKDLAWLPLVRETLSRFLKNVFQTLYYCFRLHWLLTLLVFLGVLVPYPGPSIQKCFPKKSKIKEHQSSLNSIGFAPF